MRVKVYIAASLDGYIARPDGSIDWLEKFNDVPGEDYGYDEFISEIDVILIGRHTYDKVLSFNTWPYTKDVFVLSSTLKNSAASAEKNLYFISMPPVEVLEYLKDKGYSNVYLDGGITIQEFIKEDLVDDLTITRIPVLLGSGIPLFGNLYDDKYFIHESTDVFSNGLVKSHYIRAKQ